MTRPLVYSPQIKRNQFVLRDLSEQVEAGEITLSDMQDTMLTELSRSAALLNADLDAVLRTIAEIASTTV